MDFWDLTKLLYRRWYAFVPMLIVSVALVVLSGKSINPDYKAVGHVQLIPPRTQATSNSTAGTSNPWLNLGIQALGSAVVVKTQDEAIASSMASAGLSNTYGVTMEYGTSYFSIEAVGTSAAQATGTVQRLMEVLKAEVESQQKQFGVPEREMITTLALDSGDTVTVVNSKRTRVLVVVTGITLMLSIAATVGFDALMRRPARRRSAQDGIDSGLPVRSSTPIPARESTNGARNVAVPHVPARANGVAPVSPAVPPVPAVPGVPAEDREPVKAAAVERAAARPQDTATIRVQFQFDESNGNSTDATRALTLDGATGPISPSASTEPADATVVLPVARSDWARRDQPGRARDKSNGDR